MERHRGISSCPHGILGVALFCAQAAVAAGPDPPNSMVHQDGVRIVDGAGADLQLRGVNLGGWLLWEGWEFGQGFISETEILSGLSKLAGAEAARNFRQGIYSNLVTEADIKRIAALGFNCVRVPVNYRLLDTGSHKADYGEAGWALLDQVCDWCDKYHLYAIIDLHAAPGGQVKAFIADPEKKSLWQSPEHKQETVALWRKIAARYQDSRCVAGYDLLNEPSAPSGAVLAELYGEIIAAIRAEDRRHLLFIEGNKFATDFSMFSEPPDTNMAYSFHIYTWFGDNRRKALAGYSALARNQNVPLWAGEFGENSYAMIDSTVGMFDQRPEIGGWAYWTWKRAPARSPGLNTFILPESWRAVMAWINHPFFNPRPDKAKTLEAMDAFVNAVRLEQTTQDAAMTSALTNHLRHGGVDSR